jgi:hypothetical protein
MIISTIGVYGDTVIKAVSKTVKVVFNSYLVKIDGKILGGDNLVYNGKNYVDLQQVATLLGKDYKWDAKTKTLNLTEKVKPVVQNTGVILPVAPAPKIEAKIKNEGFYNQGTVTNYAVLFDDNFTIIMSIPKAKFPSFSTYEGVAVSINLSDYKGNYDPSTINIVGFSELFNEKYYPLSYNVYKSKLPDYMTKEFMALDFFEGRSNISAGKVHAGYVWYDSFVKLEGIEFNDGVHKCKLLLEDK